MTWAIEALARRHNRSAFDCGVPALNNYLHRLASQHARRNISRTYVAVRPGTSEVAGFYSLAAGSMVLEELPDAARRKLPQYPIPTAHLAQLAVDGPTQGQGLGELLLFDALARAVRIGEELGVYAVTVDAIDERARAFYLRYGFAAIVGDPLHLYLESKVIRQLL